MVEANMQPGRRAVNVRYAVIANRLGARVAIPWACCEIASALTRLAMTARLGDYK